MIVLDYAKEFVINTMSTKGYIKYGKVYHVMKKKNINICFIYLIKRLILVIIANII